jgi:probable F420-dependent oxidoreductase
MGQLKVGATFPGPQVGRLSRDQADEWVAAIGALGFDHIALGDHPLGIDSGRLMADEYAAWTKYWLGPPGSAPHTHEAIFVEPFVTMAYLAARCDLELFTASLVLPQRQTALVAKQAAELDYLTNGKLRLCVGSGWSSLEFEALEAEFATRGPRLDEQIELLRLFWTREVVDFRGKFHDIRAASIQWLPIQRPIPVWVGGDRRKALLRAGRMADGWLPQMSVSPFTNAGDCMDVIRASALEAGRDPQSIGLEPTLYIARLSDEDARSFVDAWKRFGPTHLLVNAGAPAGMTLEQHIHELGRAARLLGIGG